MSTMQRPRNQLGTAVANESPPVPLWLELFNEPFGSNAIFPQGHARDADISFGEY
jgi:hypothetical protein